MARLSLPRGLAVVALCAAALSGCTQTYTDKNGQTQTANVPPAVLGIETLKETMNSQSLPVGQVPAKYRGSITVGAVAGFTKLDLISGTWAPIGKDRAKELLTKRLQEAGGAPGDRYTLDVALLAPASPIGLGALTSDTKILYVLRDRNGNAVFQTTQEASFTVPFKAVPHGSSRARLAFFGSYHNNIAQFIRALH